MQALPLTHTANTKDRRVVSIAIVGALHIAFIYAMLVALGYVPPPIHPTTSTVVVIPNVQTKVVQPQPPIRSTMVTPENPAVRPPVFTIGPDDGAGPGNGPQTGSGTPGESFVPSTALAGTHSIPEYPVVDRRLGHEGTVRLRLTIDAQGVVGDAIVVASSGYDGLDTAAVAWVKAHWRYKPALQNGTPVPSSTKADVTFRLTQG